MKYCSKCFGEIRSEEYEYEYEFNALPFNENSFSCYCKGLAALDELTYGPEHHFLEIVTSKNLF